MGDVGESGKRVTGTGSSDFHDPQALGGTKTPEVQAAGSLGGERCMGWAAPRLALQPSGRWGGVGRAGSERELQGWDCTLEAQPGCSQSLGTC